MAQTPGALYFSHMRDGPLIRIRLPGGRVAAHQLRVIADLAQSYGNGRVDLTNLANLQVRGLSAVRPAELKAALGGAGLLPRALWADRFRNILGDPLAGLGGGELIDTGPVVTALDITLQNTPMLGACYNKFSYVVDGGGRSGIGAVSHDVGLVAEKTAKGLHFRLFLAGYATPFCVNLENAPNLAIAATRMALSLPTAQDSPVLRLLKGAAYGPRGGGFARLARGLLALPKTQENRLRRLIKHVPLEDMIGRVAEFLKFPCERIEGGCDLARTLTPRIGVLKQAQGDVAICGFGVPLGRLDISQVNAIAQLAQEYGQGDLRLSPWHVVFIPHVPASRAQVLLEDATALGFITDESFLHIDVSACSGKAGCRGAKLDTPDDALTIMRAFSAVGDTADFAPLSVHVSGCPKGCAHRRKSDILALEREDASGYYLYEHSAALAPDMKTKLKGTIKAGDLAQIVRELALKQRSARMS